MNFTIIYLATFILIFGFVVLSTIRSYMLSVAEETLWTQSIRGVYTKAKVRGGFFQQMYTDMARWSQFLGHPEWGDRLYQLSFLSGVFIGSIAVFFIGWWVSGIAIVGFFLPYFWLRDRYLEARRKLKQQLREVRLLVANLVRTGAPLDVAIGKSKDVMDKPIRLFLEDVCLSMGYGVESTLRVETPVQALQTLAERVNMPEMTQFAQLLTQAERYDTPLAEALFNSLRIERKVRDAHAEEEYGKANTAITLTMAGFLGIPTFAFMIAAAVAYFLVILGNSGFGFGG